METERIQFCFPQHILSLEHLKEFTSTKCDKIKAFSLDPKDNLTFEARIQGAYCGLAPYILGNSAPGAHIVILLHFKLEPATQAFVW